MAVNKVIYNNETLIDLTTDTVTADKLLKGYTAHDKKGNKITGTHEETLPTGTKTITANGTYDVTDYATAKVNVPVPNGYVKPSGTKYITTTDSVDVTSYANAQIQSSTLIAENIKKGVNILGTTGTYEGSGGGGEDMLQTMIDTAISCEYLFYRYKGDNVDFIKNLNVKNYSLSYMFNNCTKIKTIPLLDTSNVIYMNSMFNDCSALETIPQLDMIKASSVSKTFYKCSKLTNLTLLNIKVNLDLSQSEKLTLESLINTVKEFINVGSARILTMGTANLSKIASTYVKFTDSSVNSIPTNEKGDVVVCESTDTGAMLLSDYALLKNWTLA